MSKQEIAGRIAAGGRCRGRPAYAVFDCETTGTDPGVDEIVSFAVVRLDADGRRDGPVRAARAAVTADSRRCDGGARHQRRGCRRAPRFAEIAGELLALLDGAVFVAHNAAVRPGDVASGVPARRDRLSALPGSPAPSNAFRLLEPLADDHRLTSICARHDIALEEAHEALMRRACDCCASASVALDEDLAPETVRLDQAAFMRFRSRGDTRPASEPQIRRVFGLARSAGLLHPDGSVDRDRVVAIVERVTGIADLDRLTREQIQDVYDALDLLIGSKELRAGTGKTATNIAA